MQSVFNRERNKYKRSYENWGENGPGAYHQHFQRDDWYWKADASFRDQRTNYRDTPRESGYYSLSSHYSVLGLDRYAQKSSMLLVIHCLISAAIMGLFVLHFSEQKFIFLRHFKIVTFFLLPSKVHFHPLKL